MKTLFLIAIALFVNSAQAVVTYRLDKFELTDKERQRHLEGIEVIMDEASKCLQEDLDFHKTFYAKHGVSPFFGSNSNFKKASSAGKIAMLNAAGVTVVRNGEKCAKNASKCVSLSDFSVNSCIGLAKKCLGRGFAKAGQSDIWVDKILPFNNAHGNEGSSLQEALRELGWVVLYWNPSPETLVRPNDKNPIFQEEATRWEYVQKGDRYLYNTVDDFSLLVGFGTQVPKAFTDIPFFLGIAHAGYHVFPGMYGHVIEAHSTRDITDSQTVEDSPFNPLQNGGGPRGDYRAGLIAVPPGYL